jgi:hypothetical protein
MVSFIDGQTICVPEGKLKFRLRFTWSPMRMVWGSSFAVALYPCPHAIVPETRRRNRRLYVFLTLKGCFVDELMS